MANEYDRIMQHGENFDEIARLRAEVARLTRERDEARDWVRKLTRENVLTCVYCGHEYPPGTPAANDEALTTHIAVCEKHPMFALRGVVTQLVAALRETFGEAEKYGMYTQTREANRLYCDRARDALIAADKLFTPSPAPA